MRLVETFKNTKKRSRRSVLPLSPIHAGLFFSIYQSAGFCGNVLSSVILLGLQASDGVRKILFCVLGGVSTLGALLFLALPHVPAAEEDGDTATIAATARLVCNPRVGLLVPLMVANGMTLAFMFGDFGTDITCPVRAAALGPRGQRRSIPASCSQVVFSNRRSAQYCIGSASIIQMSENG